MKKTGGMYHRTKGRTGTGFFFPMEQSKVSGVLRGSHCSLLEISPECKHGIVSWISPLLGLVNPARAVCKGAFKCRSRPDGNPKGVQSRMGDTKTNCLYCDEPSI